MRTGLERDCFPPGLASHLSDGGAELALKHLLQGLQLVSGDVARLLQLLQQLDGSGNIWQESGAERAKVSREYPSAELTEPHQSILGHHCWSESQGSNPAGISEHLG